MTTSISLIIDVLFDLVESVTDEPRRVLLKGVSEFHGEFQRRAAEEGLLWDVRATRDGADVVGARNDPTIATLVVFYRDEVRERESLNAFRQFDEDAIAEGLVRYATNVGIGTDVYSAEEAERLRQLLRLVHPSVEQLAVFLLQGKADHGRALPCLGLFRDPGLQCGLPYRSWLRRVEENHATAALRWREFLERGRRRAEARAKLGADRLALLRRAEGDPAYNRAILEQVTLDEALWVLNPPVPLVASLVRDGLTRERAEALIADVKAGQVSPEDLPADIPPLPERRLADLRRLIPKDEDEEDEGASNQASAQVAFCLEGLLALAAGGRSDWPRELCITRADRDESGDASARLLVAADERLRIELTPGAARELCTPNPGANDLQFQVAGSDEPRKPLIYFSLSNLSGRLADYAEVWPEAEFWERAAAIDPQHAGLWRRLQGLTERVRGVLDPEWKNEPDAEGSEPEHEPNNAIYLIFDLVYLANRELFEEFLDAWLAVATLPWRANVASRPSEWRSAIEQLLQLGLAQSDDSLAVLPFYPLRLAWHRAVFAEIESWLVRAISRSENLIFEPKVLSAQLQPVDRPRALIHGGQRLLEASSAPFFGIFVSEQRLQRARAPLDRAGQKLEQFGRMWPFSLDRLHIAFQPQDAGHDVHSLLVEGADQHRDAAFAVRALVESTGSATVFDSLLFTTGDETTDLLTQEHHQSLLPRLEYAKVVLDAEDDPDGQRAAAVHAALLVDAFREEHSGFQLAVGRLNHRPHWSRFHALVESERAEDREALKQVSLSTPAFHYGQVQGGQRDIVYVPLAGDEPEYLTLLLHSLYAWMAGGSFDPGAYYERVRWDADALHRLHDGADWVLLFDRTLETSLFESLCQQGVRLIDFYPNLRGGYRLSVSSRRTDAVKWQLVQVLQQFFAESSLDLDELAEGMLATLCSFASGLLLRTLGGGSLAQELLGLHATYRALKAANLFDPGRDYMIPLDNYQHWFGRRAQRGRRADLLILQNPEPRCLRMLAVESKWYKQLVGPSFVHEEFGPGGQLRTALESLRSLFDPQQDRLDRDHWQKTLQALLDRTPSAWRGFRRLMADGDWVLEVDGMVYVHQYAEHDAAGLAKRQSDLGDEARRIVAAADRKHFSLGPHFERLRLLSHVDLVNLFGDANG